MQSLERVPQSVCSAVVLSTVCCQRVCLCHTVQSLERVPQSVCSAVVLSTVCCQSLSVPYKLVFEGGWFFNFVLVCVCVWCFLLLFFFVCASFCENG